MRYTTLLATLAAATMLSAGAYAAPSKSTEEFVRKATIAGTFEIESSKLALEKSSNADVKKFAQTMIDDHTKAAAELKTASSKAGVKQPADGKLDEKHQAIIDDLNKESGAEFDEDYIGAQEDAHESAVALFTDYSTNGDQPDIKQFAAKTLPTLKMHKSHVQALDDKLDQDDETAMDRDHESHD